MTVANPQPARPPLPPLPRRTSGGIGGDSATKVGGEGQGGRSVGWHGGNAQEPKGPPGETLTKGVQREEEERVNRRKKEGGGRPPRHVTPRIGSAPLLEG